MAKRRHFLISFGGTAALLLLICGFWPRGVAIEEKQAQTILRVWLAADYRQSAEDPALRGPSSNAPPTAREQETAPIKFTRFELCRPLIKPTDATHAALVRVEISYSGSAPPDGENVRCFLLVEPKTKASNAVWQVRREIGESAFRWRLGF